MRNGVDKLNPLFVAFDAGSEGSLPSLNVFKKTATTFEIVKIINGREAVELYSKLTEEDNTSVQKVSV